MVNVSYDPDAGTLYWYFTEIEAGSTEAEGECASAVLLDADGQIIGVELELDESIAPGDLALALAHEHVTYDAAEFTLRVQISAEEPAERQPLEDLAILDFDADGRAQGCELHPLDEFDLAERLARLAPFLVDLDAEAEAEDAPDDEPRVAKQEPIAAAEQATNFKSGFVAIIGRPNVGKSTLLNALLGQKIAIVSPKPQTTRLPMRGILSRPDAQIIFVDTPGIHDPRTKLGSFMVEQARRAIPDSDVVCFVVDISTPPNRMDRRISLLVGKGRKPRILVLNKVDQQPRDGQTFLQAYRDLGPWEMEVAISALRAEGLETLVDEIVRHLPNGMPLYPPDVLTDQSEREHVAELVREQVLRFTEQEVPHSVAVEIEEWEQRDAALYIRATIYVEKDSQKGIIIGAQGAMLKQIGTGARRSIEAALNQMVYLDLWAKARANWRDDPTSLHWLGYSGKS